MKKKKQNRKIPKLLQIFDYRIFGYEFVKITGGLPIVLWYRIKKIYANKKIKKQLNTKPYLIAPNHNGFTDIMIVANTFWNRRLQFVATNDLYTSKFRYLLFGFFACIRVNKQDVSMQTFKDVKSALNRGHCVPVFPEGTIAKTEEQDIIEYKSGIILMALTSKVPIVPIYMEKRTKWYKRQRVVIGDMIDLKEHLKTSIPTMEDIKRLTLMLHDEECKLKALLEKE